MRIDRMYVCMSRTQTGRKGEFCQSRFSRCGVVEKERSVGERELSAESAQHALIASSDSCARNCDPDATVETAISCRYSHTREVRLFSYFPAYPRRNFPTRLKIEITLFSKNVSARKASREVSLEDTRIVSYWGNVP